MRYLFLPTLDTVSVMFGTDFAFADLGSIPTEVVRDVPLPNVDANGMRDPWVNRFCFESFIPPAKDTLEKTREEGLLSERSTRVVFRHEAGTCLGCFLHARKLRQEHDGDAPPPEPLHAADAYLAVFPRHERRIASIQSYRPMYCQACEDEYRRTGIWHEAGIHFDARTKRVLSPVLVPFFAGRFAEFSRFSELRDGMYAAFWPWSMTQRQLDELRPFRVSGFKDALDALEAVALYQDDKQIRQLAHQVMRRLEGIFVSAHQQRMDRAQLRTLLLDSEWNGAELFVVQFLFAMWDPPEDSTLARELLVAADIVAGGLPALTGAATRSENARLQILRRTKVVRTEAFMRVVQETCRENRIVAFAAIADSLLDAGSQPSFLTRMRKLAVSADFVDLSDEDKNARYAKLRAPITPLISRHGLEFNADSLAEAAMFTNRASYAAPLHDGARATRTASIFKLKRDLWAELMRTQSRMVSDVQRTGDLPTLRDTMQVTIHRRTLKNPEATPLHFVFADPRNDDRPMENDEPRVLAVPERAGRDFPTAYAFTQPSVIGKKTSVSELVIVLVTPIDDEFTEASIHDHGVVPLLREVQAIGWSNGERSALGRAVGEFADANVSAEDENLNTKKFPFQFNKPEARLRFVLDLIPATKLLISPVHFMMDELRQTGGVPRFGSLLSEAVVPAATNFPVVRDWVRQTITKLDTTVAARAQSNPMSLRPNLEQSVREQLLALDSRAFQKTMDQLAADVVLIVNEQTPGLFTLFEPPTQSVEKTYNAMARGDANHLWTAVTLGPFFVDIPLVLRLHDDIFKSTPLLTPTTTPGFLQRVRNNSLTRRMLHESRQFALALSIADQQRVLGAYARADKREAWMVDDNLRLSLSGDSAHPLERAKSALSDTQILIGLGYTPEGVVSHDGAFATRLEMQIAAVLAARYPTASGVPT
jgi:hypothetical protein